MAENSNTGALATLSVAGNEIAVVKGGTGRPLLVLHDELGYAGWLKWHTAMSQTHELHIPIHPGFGDAPRVEWVMGVRDLASFYSRMLSELDLGPVDVIGFSLGGWIAAEMAAGCSHQFRRMVLVAPTGVRPAEGEIRDLFMMTARAYLDASVHDAASTPEFASLYGGEATAEQFEAWEDARTEAAKLAWKPYMHNPSLGPMLEGVSGLPTLLVWGVEDKIVPINAGRIYNRAISGSELAALEGCGHRPEIEKTGEFVERVQKFLA
jgi:pimeloyl-ACP methyl ester carboxylesterase